VTYKPTANSNFRLTFNRAFQTPANFQMFLDLVQARTPFANVRAQGIDPVNGFDFARNSQTGVGGLYMRTSNVIPAPVGGPNQRVDANAAAFFPFFVGAANANNALVGGIQQRLVAAGLPAANAAALAGQIVTNLAARAPRPRRSARCCAPSTRPRPRPRRRCRSRASSTRRSPPARRRSGPTS
jgi:iron complex outermembrane receptor protein